MFNGIHPIINS